ncbi:MAG TPA: DUF3352 domain-containing protein [Solirubrobacteraceae bacterium]
MARLTAAVAGVFAIAAVVAAILLSSGTTPPASGAAAVVPADALLYVHASIDPTRPSVQQALASIGRLSGARSLFASVTGRLDAMLAGSGGRPVDFVSEVMPWLGREAALAVLDTPGSSAGTLVVLGVRDRARAQSFLAAQSATTDGAYRQVPLLRQPSGTTLALVGHYLVLGQAASVLAAIDTARHSAPSLAASSAYAHATAGEPADRVLDFYAPAAGVTRALMPSAGLLGALGVLLYQPALSAVSITVSPTAAGFAARVHSVLDPQVISGPARQFTPSLAGVLPAGSTMLIDAANVRSAAAKFLAAAAKLGVAVRAGALLERLGGALAAQGVSINQLFSIFGGETAFAVVPGHGGAGPAPVLVGRTPHPAAARAELGSLEEPLTQAFTPPSDGTGLVPQASDTTVAGATVSELTLAPGLQFDWTVSHGLVVLSTSPAAIASVIAHRTTLQDEASYQASTASLPTRVTSLVFFDLGPLLRLGEQTGLIGSTALAALRPHLEQIRAIGLASTSGGSDTTTQLQLNIR